MMFRTTALAIALSLAAVAASAVSAQDTARPETVKSMGFPQKWKPNAGFAVAWDRRGENAAATGEFSLNVYRDVLNPVVGIFGLTAEAYGEVVDGRLEGGGRLFGSIPVLHLHLGADYSTHARNVAFTSALTIPFRRGGLVGGGTHVRFQYTPGRNDFLTVGLQIPIFQPYSGNTRPKHDRIGLPRRDRRRADPAALSDEIQNSLGTLDHAAAWVRRYTTPFFDDEHRESEELADEMATLMKEVKRHFGLRSADYPDGHTYDAEIRVFHARMERAFALAAGDAAAGARIAQHARDEILEAIVLPYNRLLGRRKMRDSLLALGDDAIRGLDGWLQQQESALSAAQRSTVVTIFERIVAIMDRERDRTRNRWGDNRYVWIPMQYALLPEDHDERVELEELLERLANNEFDGGNRMIYVANEQFQGELARTILQARDYHLLWIHDYRGLNSQGNPDSIAYRMTRVYLDALTAAVREYDERGAVPRLMIFLDQHYYEMNKAELWLRMLADPLRAGVELPAGFEEMQRGIDAAQDELRAAVASSTRMQADAARWGDDWLHNTVKLHVNVTNPPDFSFRSRHVIPKVRFIPDVLMRDHRKIVLYDVTERDPNKGEAMFTGAGVGEHYTGPTWDDRAVLVDGPSLVDLKTSARELLFSQGFDADEIPAPLRAVPFPANYDEMVAEREAAGMTDRGMQLHNDTGFGRKPINPIKAGLYTLMPRGSQLWVPDSLWNSPLWASMMVGAALRGCIVAPVAPALQNAPSAAAPTMSRAQEIFATFVFANDQLGEEIAASGGLLLPGLYTNDLDASDMVARINRAAQRTDEVAARELLPFSQSTRDAVRGVPEIIAQEGIERAPLTAGIEDGKPRLHLKAQLFMSPEVIGTLMPLEGLGPLLQNYYVERARMGEIGNRYEPIRDVYGRLFESGEEVLRQWRAGVPEDDRRYLSAFFIGGSHNQDYRSTMMDGEVMYVAAGLAALEPFPDMLITMSSVTWIETLEQLQELLPAHEGFAKQLGRWIQNAL
jgi:hypothetical protein